MISVVYGGMLCKRLSRFEVTLQPTEAFVKDEEAQFEVFKSPGFSLLPRSLDVQAEFGEVDQ